MKLKLLHTLSAAVLALAAGAAQAVTATPAWTTFGDVVITLPGSLTLTTAYDDEPGNLSLLPAVGIADVETEAGLAAYALDLSDMEYGTEGSLARQSFSVTAGQTLSFSWSFSSAETLFLDHAFATINGQLFTLATSVQPGSASQTFTHTFSQSGLVSLAFGVIDTGDYLGVSSLSISGLQVSAVPEPSSYALLLAGLGVVAVGARRRQGR